MSLVGGAPFSRRIRMSSRENDSEAQLGKQIFRQLGHHHLYQASQKEVKIPFSGGYMK
jgi:hypothetical protein